MAPMYTSCIAVVVLAGCVAVPAPDRPIEYPKLVEGQPMVATEHAGMYTTSDCDDLTTLPEDKRAKCEEILGTKDHTRRYFTIKYGDRDLSEREYAFMSWQYEEARDKYETHRARCSRGRVPKIASYAFLVGAGGAWFLGDRAGWSDTQRYIAVGAGLGAAALMYGIGYLLSGDNCTDAKIQAEILDDINMQNESTENREFDDLRIGDYVEKFNAKHAPQAVKPSDEVPIEAPADSPSTDE